MAERKHREAVKAPEAVKVPLFSAARERVGEIEVAGAVFGRTGDKSILHEAVRMQMANRRSGTASTKTRGFISGGGQKAVAAKGHRPRARRLDSLADLASRRNDFRAAAPRLLIQDAQAGVAPRALPRALGPRGQWQAGGDRSRWSWPSPRPRLAKATLEALGLKHALIVLGEGEETFCRAARNLAAHKVLLVAGLNVYDVLNYDELLMSEPVARAIEARLKGEASKGEAPKGEAR